MSVAATGGLSPRASTLRTPQAQAPAAWAFFPRIKRTRSNLANEEELRLPSAGSKPLMYRPKDSIIRHDLPGMPDQVPEYRPGPCEILDLVRFNARPADPRAADCLPCSCGARCTMVAAVVKEIMPGPWNHWWHCMGSTYGTWRHGDRRGGRTRPHREPVEGDYRNPRPEGVGVAERRRSMRQMLPAPVFVTPDQRSAVCGAMVEAPRYYRVEAVDWTVTATHFHGLARSPSRAVADNARALRARGLVSANSLTGWMRSRPAVAVG